ncbi:hypothetical protein L6164_037116 [Bauhinia variegata]|uniref:Uncharacterized protein n=1 Tax=Bauhinia variegata TaxID=167791 RepID=A0ACB9KJ96_BAUVA|nr:hypothetical protein L6164_037116 [Bauhinia variegata]
MKTTFLVLCFLLFAYKATSTILDTDGHPVSNAGDAYYLVPVSNDLNGGLALASVGNEAEPKAAVLDPEESPGLPVRFESPLRASYIASLFSSILDFYPLPLIRKSGTAQRGYKIVYYPDRGETGGDIGLVHRDSKYRLAVKDGDPFIFKIKKATEESSAGIMNVV